MMLRPTTSFVFVVLTERPAAAESAYCAFKKYHGKLETASCFGSKQPMHALISNVGLQPALTYLQLHLPPHSLSVMRTHPHTLTDLCTQPHT